jgi:hypothetical protein
LGKKNDIEEIKAHPFFADIDWDKLLKKEIEPPMIPEFMSPKDLMHFDQDLVREEARESVVPEEDIEKINAKKDLFAKFATAHDSKNL